MVGGCVCGNWNCRSLSMILVCLFRLVIFCLGLVSGIRLSIGFFFLFCRIGVASFCGIMKWLLI